MDEQPKGITGALEGAQRQLEAIQRIGLDPFLDAMRAAGEVMAAWLDDSVTLDEFLESLDEEEREYEAARRRDIFIARKRKKQRRAKLGY